MRIMIPDVDLCNDKCSNELQNLNHVACTPACTEKQSGGGESLHRVIDAWSFLPEHVRQAVLLIVESAADAVGRARHE